MKTLKFLTFALAITFLFYACNQPTAPVTEPVAAPSQTELMKKAYQEVVKAFETGNTDSLGKYVAENSVDNSPPIPGITSTGLQHLKDIIALYRTSFPDMKFTFHQVVADGDMLMAHVTFNGTNTGPFMGGPPTNKSVSSKFIDILRFENGKFVEHWEVSDQITFMTQLGLMPQQGTPPAPVQNPTYDWNAPVTSDSARVAKMKGAYKAVMDMILAGDLTTLDQYLSADFKEHAQIPGATLPAGIEGAKQAMTMWKQVYPDLKTTVEYVVAEGDYLIAYFTMEGTYSGSIPSLPKEAAGKKVSVKSVDIIKFNAEGKATDHWDVTDHYTEMVQLGVIPAQGADA